MRTCLLSGTLLLSISLLYVSAAQPDARFDGVWVGTETTGPRAAMPIATGGAGSGTSSMMESLSQKRPAKIVIAKGGTMLAVIEGTCPGRYTDVHRSENALVFQAGDCKSELSRSADGKTLTEKGAATNALWTGSGNARYTKRVPVQLTGTFHRQKQ